MMSEPSLTTTKHMSPSSETAPEHLRNAVQLLRIELHTARIEWPDLVVPVQTLAAVIARLELALEQIEEERPKLSILRGVNGGS